MGILDEILSRKRERLSYAKTRASLRDLRARIADAKAPLDFRKAVARETAPAGVKLIAEMKKASPSRGVIRADFHPVKIAEVYHERADAISVLTEEDYFLGSLGHIAEVKAVTDRPVLRKDFIVDDYQIYESRAAGADAVLLIASVLEPGQAAEYCRMAEELGLAPLFEVHDFRELETALRIEAGIIGINNRNLGTLAVDVNTTLEMKKEIPPGRTVVSESGISTRGDVLKLEGAGVDALLIGTAFMEAPDIGAKMDELRPHD